MQEVFRNFQNLKENNQINIRNPYLGEVFNGFSFFYITNDTPKKILERLNPAKIIIIDKYEFINEQYFVICFDQTLFIIHENEIYLMNSFFMINHDSEIFILKDEIVEIFRENIEFSKLKETNNETLIFNIDQSFQDEISTFFRQFYFLNRKIYRTWTQIGRAMSGFLIKKCYKNSYIDQNITDEPHSITNEVQLKTNNYFEMKQFSYGSAAVKMIYHIELQKFFVIKIFLNNENKKLINREFENYLNVHHPFLLKCYGMTNINSKKVLILQYFDGITLAEIKNMAPIEKMDLTIKIIIVLKYLHENNYIYRDLKPDNILIGKDQEIALIDLDRMIKFDQKNPDDQTGLASAYISPEIANGFDFSYSSDIYSLGMLLYFIFFGESPNASLIEKKCGHYSRSAIGFSLCEIIYKCMREDPAKRPNINELASFFLDFYQNLANFDALNINFVNYIKCKYEYYVSFLNDPKAQLTLGCYYLNCQYSEQNIEKAIYYLTQAANQNDTQAQFMIGLAYFNGGYFVQDIDKAIHFFTPAAEKNHSEAQFYLGSIFLAGKYVDIDVNKSIHYFMLAAKNNHPIAQYNIGYIYFEGKYVKQDIRKAIYYLKLSASHNFQQAQLRLGYIYSSAEYASYDIQEAIYYYSLAAEQNNSQALFFLGCMYFTDEHNIYDINKAIYYYTLAANLNHPESQFNLGLIYFEGKYVKQDINKAIYYYTLAADLNHPESQFNLGLIYFEGKYVKQDISKAIYYYTLSANHNLPQAQHNLGFIYIDIIKDFSKAIYYFTLAADQNYTKAQFVLGVIFSEGKLIERDINKAIFYFQLAADKNDIKSLINLGLLYYQGFYIKRDIEKAVHYYSLAANLNHLQAQLTLGTIYSEGKLVKRDITKAIHYLTLAANQNSPEAQNLLGKIYEIGISITPDIYKAIHYFTLSANQNYTVAHFNLGVLYFMGICVEQNINKGIKHLLMASDLSYSQCFLGCIYFEGKHVKQDIKKAINYFALAANQNEAYAQHKLGFLYQQGEYVQPDINKAIHYYTLAANQNYSESQHNLGLIYYIGDGVPKNIKKGIYYIILASKNRYKQAHFLHGFLLHEGKNVKRNIDEAIHFYKEASSFNNQYAKNNLGVIYKNGFGDKCKKNLAMAVEYLKEAINQKNDPLSMYNLATIYIYDEAYKIDISKSIQLLINSSEKFSESLILLSLVLVKHFNFDIEAIKQEIKKFSNEKNLLSTGIQRIIFKFGFLNKSIYNYFNNIYKTRDFIYNIQLEAILSSEIQNLKKKEEIPINPKAKEISSQFYDGFGLLV